MSEQTATREERVERLRRLRAREAARKIQTARGPLMDRTLLDQISFVLFDPGAITPRGDDYQEPLWRWQARAIAYLLDEPMPQLTNTPVPAEQAAEIDRLRAELGLLRDELDSLDRNTLPQLRREIQHHQDGKKRWRDRAEKAEARVIELERPSIEARRNEIRSTYTELISQAEQDRDFEGAATLALQLRESEAKWTADDAETGGAS